MNEEEAISGQKIDLGIIKIHNMGGVLGLGVPKIFINVYGLKDQELVEVLITRTGKFGTKSRSPGNPAFHKKKEVEIQTEST